MPQHFHHNTWSSWPGWSTISADEAYSFTIWLTGLPGSGKKTIANLAKKALAARGFKVEIIDTATLSNWLKQELSINEDIREDHSSTQSYDAFVTYICMLLASNGIITITTAISPHKDARAYARKQIPHFIEVYLHCSEEEMDKRLAQFEHTPMIAADLYQLSEQIELSIDTTAEAPERSTLRVIDYLEQHGYITPLWEEAESEEEITIIKARLQALGYL